MFKQVKAILFATNLSESCRQAFDFAAAMATRFEATIILLHVMEKMPDYVEGRLRGLLGQKQWDEMQSSHERNAQEALIGKKSSNRMVREALTQFCSQVGIDDASCGYHSREIVVTDGDVVEDIVKTSKNYNCDLIILGAREGFLSKNSIGTTIKSVMRHGPGYRSGNDGQARHPPLKKKNSIAVEMPPIISIISKKNSGKTTLLIAENPCGSGGCLIPEIENKKKEPRAGINRVGHQTVKHDTHGFDIDHPKVVTKRDWHDTAGGTRPPVRKPC